MDANEAERHKLSHPGCPGTGKCPALLGEPGTQLGLIVTAEARVIPPPAGGDSDG